MNETRLRQMRIDRGLTQREVSIRTGVTEQTIQNLEKGRQKNPRLSTIKRLAECYEVSIEEIVR